VKAVCQGNLAVSHRFASPAIHYWLYNASTKIRLTDGGAESLQYTVVNVKKCRGPVADVIFIMTFVPIISLVDWTAEKYADG
jgi:hypothetical protein